MGVEADEWYVRLTDQTIECRNCGHVQSFAGKTRCDNCKASNRTSKVDLETLLKGPQSTRSPLG